MSVITNVVPNLYKYLKAVGKPAIAATKPVKNIGNRLPLNYVKPSIENSQKVVDNIASAYREYSISPYVNVYLREGTPLSPKGNELLLNLKEGIKRSAGVKGVFVRGLNPKKNLPINSDTIAEYIFNNKGFTSTAPLDKAHYAGTFAGYKGALVRFEITKPMKAFEAPNGYEVIFDTNAFTPDKFKILPEGDNNFYRVLQL